MRFRVDPLPIVDDDATIRANLNDAPIPPLLAAVAHLTGDRSLLRADLRPDLQRVLEPNGGYSAEQIELARTLVAEALARHRDAGSPAAAPLDDATLRQFVEFVAGGAVDNDQLRLLEEELAFNGADLRAPQWTIADVAPGTAFRVAIIGSGMSGIVAAHRLRQAGVNVVIFEKNADVGGTWLENDYPGCRVDIQNHFYSYSFAQTSDWPQFHSTQPVLLDYFRTCVDVFGLRPLIRFNTEVIATDWRDAEGCWNVHTRDVHGTEADESFNAIISAVGQLNRPMFPDIAGMNTFAGASFHSARWDHDIDLHGRRVVVIGTGASAAQFIPVVAQQAAQLTIMQRTPPWLLPVPIYEDDVPESLRWLLRHAPDYARWDRLWIFARTQEGLLPLARVDDAWPGNGLSVSAANQMMRDMLTAYYDVAFADPSLREKMIPDYPPTAKRVVLDNGSLPAALQRPNVNVITTPIASIDATGVITEDGTRYDADVIIYGTGFQASKFLTPMQVRGANGVDLHERWGGDARAYLGITIPEFPNLFLMYGPNTNIVINGSIIYFSECETSYIVDAVRSLVARHARAMSCRAEVHDAYNARVDAGNRSMAWGVSGVNSWYKNEFGRVAQNWPFNLFEYWKQTRAVNPADYEWT